jgi:hypothetical protein
MPTEYEPSFDESEGGNVFPRDFIHNNEAEYLSMEKHCGQGGGRPLKG